MKLCVSEGIRAWVRSRFFERTTYFCPEPWIGIFSVGTDGDVTCCPCYAKMKVGNVNDSPVQEIWNSGPLLSMRKTFKRGKLPRQCTRELCPVVVGKGMPDGEERLSGAAGVDR